MVAHQALRHAGTLGDRARARTFEATLREQAERRIEERNAAGRSWHRKPCYSFE